MATGNKSPENPHYALYERVAKNIRHLREITDVTQTELGDRLGTHYTAVLHFEKVHHFVTTFHLYWICRIFKVPFSEIVSTDLSLTRHSASFRDRRPSCNERVVYTHRGKPREVDKDIDEFYAMVGERIRQCRKSMKITQKSLAEATEMNRVSIVRIESGESHVMVHTLLKLAVFFQVPIDSLLED